MRGATTLALIQTLNPIISGWAAYYRTAVSSAVFSALDDYVWKLALKWATRRHRTKPKRWIADRYFGRFHPEGKGGRWVFGDRASGAYLQKFSWTRIVRHQLVAGGSSPDDPALADYWARRRRKHQPPLGEYALFQLQRQHGRCPLCRDYLLHADHGPTSTAEWEQWFRVTRKAITKHSLKIAGSAKPGTPDRNRIHLVHTRCRPHHSPPGGTGPALLHA
jgi:RNA-directed DNA polymerase